MRAEEARMLYQSSPLFAAKVERLVAALPLAPSHAAQAAILDLVVCGESFLMQANPDRKVCLNPRDVVVSVGFDQELRYQVQLPASSRTALSLRGVEVLHLAVKRCPGCVRGSPPLDEAGELTVPISQLEEQVARLVGWARNLLA